MTEHLDSTDIDPSSYVDPHGFVFRRGNDIYRCIRPEFVGFYKSLTEAPSYMDLVEIGLIDTESTDLIRDDVVGGWIVKHPTINPLSYCNEWCPAMLWEAARVTLDLALALAERDLILHDAYPWNVLFDGATPKFVDLTSVTTSDGVALWSAHEQYEAYFARPLALMNQGKGAAVRALLLDNIDGIGVEQFARLSSPISVALNPSLLVQLTLERRLQSNAKFKRWAGEVARKSASRASPLVRKKFLSRLRKSLQAQRREPQGDCWTNYYAEIEPGVDKQAKLDTVRSLLQQIKPSTVADLGCNTGVFSIAAAQQGARVFAVDASESCINLLYAEARREGYAITPFIANLAAPTPASGFMSEQYPSLFDRVEADTVLCLGLMHHLHIAARQSFPRIAALLNKVAKKHLIFEYVDAADENNALLPKVRKIDYDLNVVREALGKYFSKIIVHPSDRESRRLLICEK